MKIIGSYAQCSTKQRELQSQPHLRQRRLVTYIYIESSCRVCTFSTTKCKEREFEIENGLQWCDGKVLCGSDGFCQGRLHWAAGIRLCCPCIWIEVVDSRIVQSVGLRINRLHWKTLRPSIAMVIGSLLAVPEQLISNGGSALLLLLHLKATITADRLTQCRQQW